MEHIAKEKDVIKTVRDFEIICEYINKNKPIATKKGDLPTKACFELKFVMYAPKKWMMMSRIRI